MELIKIKEVLFNDNLSSHEKYIMFFGEDHSKSTKKRSTIRGMKKMFDIMDSSMNMSFNNTVSINNDNTQTSDKIIPISSKECFETKLKSKEYLLDLHGYDPKEFTLLNSKSSIWNQSEEVTLYSSKITVKPIDTKSSDNIMNMLEDFYNSYNGPTYKQDIIKTDTVVNNETKLLEINICDAHLGLYTNKFQTNEEANLELSISTLKNTIDKVITKIQKDNTFNKIVISFLGDYLHVDNKANTTTRGTAQDVSTFIPEIFQRGLDTAIDIISNIASLGIPVEVIYIPGNHDEMLGCALMKGASLFFKNNDWVSFDTDQRSRKYRTFGNSLIGWTHGDNLNKANMNSWLQTEARKEFGETLYAEVHAAHFHSQQVQEANGVIVRHLPTITPASTWEYNKGYFSNKAISCFIWDFKEGLTDQWLVSPN